MEERFSYTNEGYLEASQWLRSTGRWEYVSTHGFSVDGYSLVLTANNLWKQIHPTDGD